MQSTQLDIEPFPLWKTLPRPTEFRTASTFHAALKKARPAYSISQSARELLEWIDWFALETPPAILISNITCGDLGLTADATLETVYRAAQALGLRLCPPETGPLLSLNYAEQPAIEELNIAMEPSGPPGRLPRIFSCVGNSVLATNVACPESEFRPRDRFVFLHGGSR
jgi:hypothetical protein